ncbi:MAG: hypothetical protein ACKO7N_10175, partial [Candidatus Nitrosotenuis sp.]
KKRGSDTIPAITRSGQKYMLADGEYIVNAKSSKKYRPLIDAINSDTLYAANGMFLSDEDRIARTTVDEPDHGRIYDPNDPRLTDNGQFIPRHRDAYDERKMVQDRIRSRLEGLRTTLRQLEMAKKERQGSIFRSISGAFGDNSEELQRQRTSQDVSTLEALLDRSREKHSNIGLTRDLETSLANFNATASRSAMVPTREFRPGQYWGGETKTATDNEIQLENAKQGINVTRDIVISAATAFLPGGGGLLANTGARLLTGLPSVIARNLANTGASPLATALYEKTGLDQLLTGQKTHSEDKTSWGQILKDATIGGLSQGAFSGLGRLAGFGLGKLFPKKSLPKSGTTPKPSVSPETPLTRPQSERPRFETKPYEAPPVAPKPDVSATPKTPDIETSTPSSV